MRQSRCCRKHPAHGRFAPSPSRKSPDPPARRRRRRRRRSTTVDHCRRATATSPPRRPSLSRPRAVAAPPFARIWLPPALRPPHRLVIFWPSIRRHRAPWLFGRVPARCTSGRRSCTAGHSTAAAGRSSATLGRPWRGVWELLTDIRLPPCRGPLPVAVAHPLPAAASHR